MFLLPGSDSSGAMEIAERIRSAVAQAVVTSPSGDFSLTISMGVAAFAKEDADGSGQSGKASSPIDFAPFWLISGPRKINEIKCTLPTDLIARDHLLMVMSLLSRGDNPLPATHIGQ